MDDVAMDRLLSGDLARLPSIPKRVVRLFISSTFTDMTLERNSLMERVYPRLKKYCRERHGLDFQVVDMRWGVRDEATDDHQTVTLCSREIENCQRVSLGPNFIALIGDKYGFRPLLNRIKSAEYRLLRRCLIESDINTDFLDTWYKEDLNAMPPEYLLQPISSILKNFTNKNEPELQMVDQRIWQAIQERLHDLLLIGSSRLVKQGRMSEREQLLRYSISVTEREVLEGCLDINEAKSHCLVYVRSIVDLRENLLKCIEDLKTLNGNANKLNANDGSSADGGDLRRDSATRKASLKIGDDTISLTTSGAQTASERKIERTRRLIGRYIDLTSKDGEWQVDEAAQSALKELKEIKLAGRLAVGGRNLTIYQVHWNEQDGVSLKSDEHKNYVNELTDHFYANLTRMIRSAVKSERSKTNTAGLIGEALQHSHYALQTGKSVFGRVDELDQIRTYILTGQYQQQHQQPGHGRRVEINPNCPVLPMFVYGVSGSGKTSILARVASFAYNWIEHARRRRRSSVSLQSNNVLQGGLDAQTKRWDRKPCVIMRFCCTTPASSSMVGMLTSVCRQLQYNFYQFGPLNGLLEQQQQQLSQANNARLKGQHCNQLPYQQIPEDFVRLVYTFRQLIENCRHQLHRRRVFVIIIDSIERLSSPAESSVEAKYSWLTSITQLPQNVRLIVSCSSTCEGSAQLDYVHLKRHFLQAHLKALSRINDSHWLTEIIDGGTPRSSSSCSSRGSDDGSDSLNFSSTTSSSIDSLNMLPGEGRTSSNGHQQTKYGRLLKRLVLPAIRIKRGSRADSGRALGSGQQSTVRFDPINSRGRLSASDWSPAKRETDFRFNVSNELNGTSLNNDQDDLLGRNTKMSTYLGLLHIRPLGRELAVSVLRRWLAESGRNLIQQQWSIVERSFSHCSRPIFVKLALGEVINWKSYSTQGDTKGLTFGSAWLADMPLNNAVSGDHDDSNFSSPRNRLLRMMRERETAQNSEEEENKFKWQMLAMEQQWLNYLDYKSRLEQQRAAATDSSGAAESGNLIIRVGGAGNVTTTTGSDMSANKSIGPSSSGPNSAAGSSSMSICHLSDTIEDAICQLFSRIELQHGYLLTKHSLSYITAARNGICENELEDILSLDDVVLDDVFQYHLPPVRRIPPLLWTRIRNDLPDYLSERDADGIVITWHHSQFKTVTERRYLNEAKQSSYIHSLLADYFLGKWADKAKPFRCTKQQIQMAAEQLESAVQQSMRDSTSQQQGAGLMSAAHGTGRLGSGSVRTGTSFSVRNRLRSSDQHDQRLQWMQAKAHRRVPNQPLYYDSSSSGATNGSVADNTIQSNSGSPNSEPSKLAGDSTASFADSQARSNRRVRYNLRKLTELPHHLLRSGRFNELASCVLFNYKWLIASIDALGLQSLFADFEEALVCLRAKLDECNDANATRSDQGQHLSQNHPIEQLVNDCVPSDELDAQVLGAMIDQIGLLASTLRLSSSIIHSNPHMLAPQLLGRLVAVVEQLRQKHIPDSKTMGRPLAQQVNLANLKQLLPLGQLLQQCDKNGASDCALLPIDQCLQSPDGLQLSSLEGHPFGVMSMALANDRRHLLAVSSKFIMWNVSTGEIAREIDPKIHGSIMRRLAMGLNNQLAIAHTSDNLILVLDILTQQVNKCDHLIGKEREIRGLRLVDHFGARRFLIWTDRSWHVFRLDYQSEASPTLVDQNQEKSEEIVIRVEYEVDCAQLSTNSANIKLLDVHLVEFYDKPTEHLVHCIGINQSSDTISLLVIHIQDRRAVREWVNVLETACLALSQSGEQVLYADLDGDIYLRRRRARTWSKAKLIRSSKRQAGKIEEFGSINIQDKANKVPLRIEVDNLGEKYEGALMAQQLSERQLAQVANFERKVDRISEHDEIEPVRVFQTDQVGKQAGDSNKLSQGVRFVKLYRANCITVLQLDRAGQQGGYDERCLVFPRDVRNVCVGPNECQLSSVMMKSPDQQDGHYLIVAAGRKLLVFSVLKESLLRTIDAHAARITELLPVSHYFEDAHENGDGLLSVASSSLDKSVKIWNLLNISKGTQLVDKLASGPIEAMSVCTQRPLVACLSRGQLSVWDWRTMKIVAQYTSDADFNVGSRQQTTDESLIIKSKFSPNGRYLAAATLNSCFVLAVESATKQSESGRLTPTSPETTDRAKFKLVAHWSHPRGGLVIGMEFISQDSRLITMVKCFGVSTQSGPKAELESRASSGSTNVSTFVDEEEFRLTYDLSISSHVISDSRLQYAIACQVPKCKNPAMITQQFGQANSSRNKMELIDRQSVRHSRSVALTCDQQFLVIVDSATNTVNDQNSSQQSRRLSSGPRRRSSALSRAPLVLNVYSTRDGSLAKTVDLRRLQTIEQGDEQQRAFSRRSSTTTIETQTDRTDGNELQIKSQSDRQASQHPGSTTTNPGRQEFVTITSDQFNRLKSIKHRDRQTLIALIDDERGSSFIVDIATKCLVAFSSSWNGKLTSDGRHGLSRLFNASPTTPGARMRADRSALPSAGGLDFNSGGLRLLEMRRCRAVKTLLSLDQLNQLGITSEPTGGAGGDILCGITHPNDAYAYYCESRLKQLLLIRLRDSQLIAKYKLSTPVTRIKCSGDGYALVLAQSDGSLTSLAIVDPQTSDTLARLGQYPSRRRMN